MTASDTLPGLPKATTTYSLAELRARILADLSLPDGRRADMVSAITSLGKALGRPLETIQADPALLREEIRQLTPAMVGLKSGRWRNIKSLLSMALAHAGLVRVQGRISGKPSKAWLESLSLLGTVVGREFHLWRFARYCTGVSVDPRDVADEVLARYQHDLTGGSMVSDPKRAAREAARAWNRASIAHPAWPRQLLTIPDNRNIYAPAMAVYPASLLEDIERWFARQTDTSPFKGRPGKPLRASSVKTNRRHLRTLLGALLLGGVPVAELVDLTAVVSPARYKIALTYFWNRAGGRPTVYCYKHAQIMLAIARHHAKLPAGQIVELEAMMAHVKPEGSGMTERNRHLLRQLHDPQSLDGLLNLPERLVRKAARIGASVSTARDVQTAATIMLLLHLPMRLGNLRDLRLGMHVTRNRRGLLQITVLGREVKNGVPIIATLSKANHHLRRSLPPPPGTGLE